MYLGLVTDCLADCSLEEILKKYAGQGIAAVELGCGNWSAAPHVDLEGLLSSSCERQKLKDLLARYGVQIAAFNCSGNPLAPGDWGRHDLEITKKTFQLSEYFGLDTVVMMSGLPGGGPDDHYPNWIVTSWPPETQAILNYQWQDVAIPTWRDEIIPSAKAHGIRKIALEPHGSQLVYNVETLRRLRDAVGEIIGFNLDPSHLFWMGADPLAVIRELNEVICHVHIKDVRIERQRASINTLLDTRGVLEYGQRSWNFAIPGYGHDSLWWKEFVVLLKMTGYAGVLSIELEDYTLGTELALDKTIRFLRDCMI
jgi:sugar phosphate isomerase/epimerase